MTIARLFMKRQVSTRVLNEVQLLHEVRQAYPDLSYDDLSRERLALLSQERGVDFATALFYDRIGQSVRHGSFIREVDSLVPDLGNLPQIEGKVLLSPATFYRHFPQYGGDGLLIRQIAAQFGLQTSIVPVPSGSSVREGVPILRQALMAEPDQSVILVSLSKGGSDARLVLAEGQPVTRKVRAWIQICGVIRGYPLFTLLLRESRFRLGWRLILHTYFTYLGGNTDLFEDFMYQPGALLSQPPVAPEGILLINVIGCPLSSHLTGTVGKYHRKLAPLGPNDGYTLLRDGIIEPGFVYPVWSANHYFRFAGSARLIYQLFLWLAHKEGKYDKADIRGDGTFGGITAAFD